MRRLLARKAPVRVEENEPGPVEAQEAHVNPRNSTYPTYVEIYAPEARREREPKQVTAPFRFGQRRERSGVHNLGLDRDDKKAQKKADSKTHELDPRLQEQPDSDSSGKPRPAHSDNEKSPYPVYRAHANDLPQGDRNRTKDRSSGIFKWKRASGVPEVARRGREEAAESETHHGLHPLSLEISKWLLSPRQVLPRDAAPG